jgi:uncharacterized damage-inducible protein DinB
MDERLTGNPILANLFGMNQWANLALIDACAALDTALLDADAPGTRGTIRETLWHLIETEHHFLAALAGEEQAAQKVFAEAPAGDLSTLRLYAHDSGEGLTAWAEVVDGDPMLAGEWDDGPYRAPASMFAAQALLHAKEHRAQVQEALERAGIDGPDLSAWAWWASLETDGPETPTI